MHTHKYSGGAKIRMPQQELQDEEERMHKSLEVSSSNVNVAVADVEYISNASIFFY